MIAVGGKTCEKTGGGWWKNWPRKVLGQGVRGAERQNSPSREEGSKMV